MTDEHARSHSVQLLAARRWREISRPVPDDFERLERLAAAMHLAAPAVLARVRDAVQGPVVLYKGPQAAAAYPEPGLRGFDDLDLIVPNAPAAQLSLVAEGFVEIGDPALYRGIHHLRPLEWPGLPLRIEVHSSPKWPALLNPPLFAELLDSAVPAAPDVEGVLAPSPEHHALLLAAHAWAHVPLRRIRDLVDIAAAAQIANEPALEAAAHRWELDRVWRATRAAAGALFLGEPRTLALRTWARHLAAAREPSVLESHLQRDFSPFWTVVPRRAAGVSARHLLYELAPAEGDTWREKLARTGAAVRRALRPRPEHDRSLGPLAQRPRRVSRPPDDER